MEDVTHKLTRPEAPWLHKLAHTYNFYRAIAPPPLDLEVSPVDAIDPAIIPFLGTINHIG